METKSKSCISKFDDVFFHALDDWEKCIVQSMKRGSDNDLAKEKSAKIKVASLGLGRALTEEEVDRL